MRKILSVIILFLCFFPLNAQNITGKWKCRKGALEQLGVQYKCLRGHCKFKGNGTFEVQLNSTREVSSENAVYVKVAGTYKVEGNRITTVVDPQKTYCNSGNLRFYPYSTKGDESSLVDINIRDKMHNRAEDQKALSENVWETELERDWTWRNEPLTLTKGSLLIGSRVKFIR